MNASPNSGSDPDPSKEDLPSGSAMSLKNYRSLIRLLKSFPLSGVAILGISCLMLLDIGSQLASPLLTRSLVDGLNQGTSVTFAVVLLSVVMICGTIVGALTFFWISRLSSLWVAGLREQLTQNLLLAPVSFFHDKRSSEPASHIIKDSSLIQGLVSQQTLGVITGLLVVIGCVVIMGGIDIVLTGVLLGIVLLAFAITVPIAAGITKLSQKLQKEEAEGISMLGEIFSETILVKTLTAQMTLFQKQKERIWNLFGLEMKELRIQALLGPVAGVSISAGMIAILAFGSYRVSTGVITMGDLLAFILYLFNIVIPLAQVSVFIGSLNKAAGAADKLVEFLDAPQEKLEEGIAAQFEGQEIHFRNLNFHFGSTPILNQIDLTIVPGKMTALVGQSGAGKSTILNLLARIYPTNPEQFYLGDLEATEFSLASWRKQVAFVAQSAPVFSGSLRENLTLGLDREVVDGTILNLIDQFGLSELFPEGEQVLDGSLAEGGKNLSGGQKQRIAIARAILRQPKLLLLDEATSSLDALTEKQVTSALDRLSQNTTTVVAAHRLSTVAKAYQIVVMKEGKVLDIGKHPNLMDRCEYYRELVQNQMLPPAQQKIDVV